MDGQCLWQFERPSVEHCHHAQGLENSQTGGSVDNRSGQAFGNLYKLHRRLRLPERVNYSYTLLAPALIARGGCEADKVVVCALERGEQLVHQIIRGFLLKVSATILAQGGAKSVILFAFVVSDRDSRYVVDGSRRIKTIFVLG
jgi:hypothetical protein